MPLHLDLMPIEEKPPEAPPPKTMVVRYGYLREIGEFPSDVTQKTGCGTKLVIRTDRGTEIAEMLTTACGNGGCTKSITRDKLLDYIEHSGGRNYPFSEQGRILRIASVQDLAEQSKLDEHKTRHLNMARDLVSRHKLPMKIVEVEHVLGGERILFYFISEQRIDFRTLVRDLAHELHTRIEMHQVGARDEARLTADYEKCGQHCCCKQFLKVLTPISMRSAKIQKATLDPTKISGRCGRLMCCLRYEDQTYEELRKKLPKRNTRVRTEKGDAWVVDGQILTQLVLVQYDDFKREAIPMEKILEFDRPKPVMADGRTMQSPNDRPPQQMMEADPRARGPRGPGGPPPLPSRGNGPPERPRPGAPAQTPEGDPRAIEGPTGGDLNNGEPLDEIDLMIADASDDGPPIAPNTTLASPSTPDSPSPGAPFSGTSRPAPTSPPLRNPPPPMPGRGGPPQNQPRGPGPRPPQQQQRGGPSQPRPKGNPGPAGAGGRPPQNPNQGPRGPQGFRPPNRQQPPPPPRANPNPSPPPLPTPPLASQDPPPPPPASDASANPPPA